MSCTRFFSLLIGILLIGGAVPTFAQETDLLKTDVIWQRERLDTEIVELQRSYQGQLEEYLYKDKLFRIAHDQYKQLQTLASIEDMVNKGRELALIRGQVLLSYLNLLRLHLITTEGIEVALKEHYIKKLEESIAYITDHQELLRISYNRDNLSSLLLQFSKDQGTVNELAKEVLVLLSIGKLQAIYDRLIIFKQDIDIYLTEQSVVIASNLERASHETDRSLDSAKIKLDAFWSEAVQHGKSGFDLVYLYDDLTRVLNPIYVNLSQSVSYLSELLDLQGQQ